MNVARQDKREFDRLWRMSLINQNRTSELLLFFRGIGFNYNDAPKESIQKWVLFMEENQGKVRETILNALLERRISVQSEFVPKMAIDSMIGRPFADRSLDRRIRKILTHQIRLLR